MIIGGVTDDDDEDDKKDVPDASLPDPPAANPVIRVRSSRTSVSADDKSGSGSADQ